MELYKAQNEDEFLYLAYHNFKRKINVTLHIVIGSKPEEINWLYKLGRDLKLLNIDFKEFETIIKNNHKNYREGKWFFTSRYTFNTNHYFSPENFRRQRHFRQKRLLIPKKVFNQAEEDWWDKKQFIRDRHRNTSRERWWTSSKKNLKHYGARKHRQMVRKAINSERFDLLGPSSYKQAEDIWAWD